MAETIEAQVSNAEIKRCVLKLLREGGFNQDEVEHLFRQVYAQIEKRYEHRTTWAYNHVSRRYTKQVAAEMKAQRKEDVLLLKDIYK